MDLAGSSPGLPKGGLSPAGCAGGIADRGFRRLPSRPTSMRRVSGQAQPHCCRQPGQETKIMFAVTIIQGERRALRGTPAGAVVLAAVTAARRAGATVGRRVRIGTIPGRIIGYNIASAGVYPGTAFPLLVATEYGLAKCSLAEIRFAA
jgi:hypothetical protein